MNAYEGSRKMRQAGKRMVVGPIAGILLIGGGMLALNSSGHHVTAPGVLDFLILLFCLVIPGEVFWLAGWIVEGFAKHNN